ncbi:MAG: hypothetical protein HY459_01870, partial [Parcubacteria group bacterium]|nr:hypothetical protein [Parcubacteria group bacterium]
PMPSRNEKSILVVILLGAFLLRVALSSYGTYLNDFNTFIGWSERITKVGAHAFYSEWSDYLPGYIYVLWGIGLMRLVSWLNSAIPVTLWFKLPAMLADIGIMWIGYRILRPYVSMKQAFVAVALIGFNPALIANSTLWGQVDSLNTFFIVLTLWYALTKSKVKTGVGLALATVVKPQSVLAAFPVAFRFLHDEKWLRLGIGAAASFVVTLSLLFLPFAGGMPFATILTRVSATLNQYSHTSLNAFNFWALGDQWWIFDGDPWLLGVSYKLWGVIFFFALLTVAIFRSWSRTPTLADQRIATRETLWYAAVTFASMFFFLTRVHERHLLPLLPLLALTAGFGKRLWIAYALFSLTYLLNLLFSYHWLTRNFIEIFSQGFVNLLVLTNGLALVLLITEGFSAANRTSLPVVSEVHETP